MKYGSIIVTYNRKALVLEAINSVLTQTLEPEVLILIDNHATDGTDKLIKSSGILDNPKVKYIRLEENVGGAGGFAEGIKIAQQMDIDWVSLSDDDAIYETDYFEKLSVEQQKHPEYKSLAGTVMLPDGRVQNDHRGFLTNPYWLKRESLPEQTYKTDKTSEVDWFTFCGCLLSMDVIRKIGLPNVDYFIWWDDFEYSLRVLEYSKTLNVNDALLIHKTAIPSLDTQFKYVRDWRTYYGIRNKIFMIKAHGKNKLVANLFLLYWYPRIMTRLFKKMYTGNRGYLFHTYNDAYRDGFAKRGGVSQKHLPGSAG